MTSARIFEFMDFLASLPIVTDNHTSLKAFGEILSLARARRLSVYDAAYLELAMREGCPLASLDEPLNEAAIGVGVKLFDG